MKRDQALNEVQAKYGQIRGQELIELFNEYYTAGWGARFLAHDRCKESAYENPSLNDLTKTALVGLACSD